MTKRSRGQISKLKTKHFIRFIEIVVNFQKSTFRTRNLTTSRGQNSKSYTVKTRNSTLQIILSNFDIFPAVVQFSFIWTARHQISRGQKTGVRKIVPKLHSKVSPPKLSKINETTFRSFYKIIQNLAFKFIN